MDIGFEMGWSSVSFRHHTQTVYHTTLSTSLFTDTDNIINIVRLPGLNWYTLKTFTLLGALGAARFASIFRVPATFLANVSQLKSLPLTYTLVSQVVDLAQMVLTIWKHLQMTNDHA